MTDPNSTSIPSYDYLLVEVDSATPVATVTINRPEARNAVSAPALGELHAVMERPEGGPAVDLAAALNREAEANLRRVGSPEFAAAVGKFPAATKNGSH